MQKSEIPIGLKNQLSYCYLNALLQAILRCKSFVKYIKADESDNIVVKTLKKMILQIENGDNDIHQYPVMILNLITKLSHGQESSSEAMIYILEAMGVDNPSHYILNDLFTARYIDKVYCELCKKVYSIKERQSNQIFLFNRDDIEYRGIVEHLISTNSLLLDFKCEDICCGAPIIMHNNQLVHLPPILCIIYNAYNVDNINNIAKSNEGKSHSSNSYGNSPSILTVKYNTYKKRSEVIHCGTLDSGHYAAKIYGSNCTYIVDDDVVFSSDDISQTEQFNIYNNQYNVYIVFYEQVYI